MKGIIGFGFAATTPLAVALITGCGSHKTAPGSGPSEEFAQAQVGVALSGGNFTGNSLRVCGSRSSAPDGKFRCASFVSPPDVGTTGCPCFNFNPDGTLNQNGGDAIISGLCPSEDPPTGDWTFQYFVFDRPGCMGTQLNDGTHNFTCFDANDVGSQMFPNESVESLTPGLNMNHVLCTTKNASKDWNFESCADTTTDADTAAGHSRLDCGCTPTGSDTCDCGDGGVSASDLEAGCFFDPATCNILCNTGAPQGSCATAAQQSVLVSGFNVVSYVPKGTWLGGHTGISVVNVEGSAIVPVQIPTSDIINSCASNSLTGTTVCTANNNHVLVLSGTTPPAILSSAGSGTSSTIPGSCTNCYVTMDAIHNRAWIGLHLDEGTHGCAAQNPFCQGFQSLDLNTNTFDAPFASESAQNFIGWTAVVDPFRNLLLSATPDRNFEVIDVENPNSPSFFVRIPTLGLGEAFNATGEDCTTRIALAPVMQSIPPFGEPTLSSVLVADLMQATFTPGTPAGTWDGPAEEPQTLAESTVLEGTNAAIAVAQGTHLGILYSLVDSTGPSNLVTAIALPDTSGSGTPEITDWVTCGILSDWVGQGGPQKTNAYKSPNTGHAMATVVNGNFGSSPTMMAVIDLTLMLDPTVVTRTSPPSGGHLCTDGVLPSSVVRFILIP